MKISSAAGRSAVVSTIILIVLSVLGGCSRNDSGKPPGTISKHLRIGHVGNPIAAPLYAAEGPQAARPDGDSIALIQFKTSADAGYALLSGDLDAALIEPSRASGLLQSSGAGGLKVAGAVQFPYGAVLVLRKDLSLRLADLAGRKVAAEGSDCELFHQFSKDALRLGVDLKRIQIVYMPFDDMLSALEAKLVDAILTKGAYGAIGESLGHKILYQKWDVEAGADTCCPAILAQTFYFLVVRPIPDASIARLVQRLETTNQIKAADVRALVSAKTGISSEQLARLPVATFSPVTDQLRLLLKERAWNPK